MSVSVMMGVRSSLSSTERLISVLLLSRTISYHGSSSSSDRQYSDCQLYLPYITCLSCSFIPSSIPL